MDWKAYNACCHRNAADVEAAFCPECRHELLRCLGFAECRTLVAPEGQFKVCSTCMAPHLSIDTGAVINARRGDRLSIPLVLLNASPAGRPFWVMRVARRTDGGPFEDVPLTFKHVDARAERSFSIDIPPIAHGGIMSADLMIVVASRYKMIEEQFAFSARMQISVATETGGHTTVNITNTNSTYYAPVRGASEIVPDEKTSGRTMLALQPAEEYELQQGVRGYRDEHVRVPRSVEFAFRGFAASDRPADGKTILQTGRLVCGRNSRTAAPAAGALPSDLCLRAYDRQGLVDEPATLAISRHHFDLLVVNDRLSVHARSTRGLELNGQPLETGEIAVLKPGDRLVPIPGRPEKLSLGVDFATSFDSVTTVEISRTPAMS